MPLELSKLANQRGGEASQYKTVLASQTTAPIGLVSTGKPGDYIDSMTVVPNSSTAGAVTLFDGTTAVVSIPAQAGGTGCPLPYTLYLGMRAQARWNITTGTSVSVVVIGSFK